MGDALAVALLERRQFKAEDFAFLHPGGALGRQLLKIDDIMFTDDNIPSVAPGASFREVILEITQKRFGCTCVVDGDRSLLGIITDGDLRRLMAQRTDFDGLYAADIFNPDPKVVIAGSPAVRAREIIEEHNIMQVAVVDDMRRLKGIVHLHDLLEAGL
jgi:arabinose-5-phosphate isomerase